MKALAIILAAAAIMFSTGTWSAEPLRGRFRIGIFLTVIVVEMFSIGTLAAEPLPQPKPPGPGGACPHGYTSSGSFCVPSRRERRGA
jgi:hypothetical protein